MGLLDRFFKPKLKEETQEPISQNESQHSIKFFEDNEGKSLIVEYYDSEATAKEFYDTTKLVIDLKPNKFDGILLYSAKVAWYNEDDACFIDELGNQSGSKFDFTDIKVEIDMDRLYKDPKYQEVLMIKLLDKKRVEYEYIPMGLEENPNRPCGNYVGSVNKDNSKQFNPTIGRSVHYSPEMIKRRRIELERRENEKQARIRDRQEKIERLQSEINQLSN